MHLPRAVMRLPPMPSLRVAACGWPTASHGSNNEVTSNAGSGLEAAITGGCGTSSAAEEGDSHGAADTQFNDLMPIGSMPGEVLDPKCEDFCLDFDLGPDFGLLVMEDDEFGMGPIAAAEPWLLTACTSSHPLSHHCPGATNIELLEDPEDLGLSSPQPPASAPATMMRPMGSHQLSAPSSPGTARSMPHQQQHVPYGTAMRRSSGSNQQQQRPRAPPLLAPQPPRTSMHTPFITVGGARNETVASAVVSHSPAWAGSNASPSTDISDSAELSHADMPNSPSWGNPAGCRKNPTAARLMRPARSMPNFASMSNSGPATGSPRAASMVPDLLAPAPKRQAPLRRSPSEGYELPRARPNGVHSVPPVMAPALRSHASANALNMVAPVDVGYGMHDSGLDLVHDDDLGGLGELESAWNEFSAPEPPPPPPPPPPVHPPLPHFPNGPVIPPEAQPALAALAAMLPPRNNRKRANGGHGSTCARPAPHPHGHGCTACGTQTTPVWRAGPAGPKTLCNACGVRYMKVARGGGLPPPKKS